MCGRHCHCLLALQTEDAGGAEAATAPTAADTVELAVKWQKQEITIHVEPGESVQVRSAMAQRQAGSTCPPCRLPLSSATATCALHIPRAPPLPTCSTPQGIKRKLEVATSVNEKRMKLLGLKVGAAGVMSGTFVGMFLCSGRGRQGKDNRAPCWHVSVRP